MSELKVFENRNIRTLWNEEKEDWWFSAIDVSWVLTDSKDYQTARKYWNKLKQRLKEEGSELVTYCHRLKLVAEDGKMRETDVLDTNGFLKFVQPAKSCIVNKCK